MPAPWQQQGPPAGTEGQLAKKQPGDFSFPVKGYDENWAYKAQPEGTTPDCLNVRPYDTIAQRLRGGSRPGTSKYFGSAVDGSNPIQRMGLVMQSIVGGPSVSASETFTQADGVLSTVNWNDLELTFASTPNFIVSATNPRVTGNKIVLNNTTHPANWGMCAGIHKTAAILADAALSVSIDVTMTIDAADWAVIDAGVLIKVPSAPSFPLDQSYILAPHLEMQRFPPAFGGLTLVFWSCWGTGVQIGSGPMTPGSGDYMDPLWWAAAPRTVKFDVAPGAGLISVSVNGTFLASDFTLHTFPHDWSPSNPGIGFYMSKTSEVGNALTLDNWSATSSLPISNRKPTIIAVSGGSVYTGNKNTGLALATSGTSVLSLGVEKVRMTDSLGKMYFVDGTNYKVWDNATNTVSTWTAATGTLPISGSNTCRLIANYRSRIVLAGLVDDPQNWFMSALGDSTDWDYGGGGTISATMAVSGNNTVAGKCPDIITALIPFSDDMMVIGGDHTLWVMRGDPADGGRIDNYSQQMGILGSDSWCIDPDGTIYFFGNGVLWKMPKPQPYQKQLPEPLSRGRLDKTFGAIDYSSYTVKLLWDETFHGIHIFIAPVVEGATYHYWWDLRTDSFWKEQYPTVQGPTSVMIFDADSPSDRAVLLGGWDSYIRQIDAAATDDDGTAITSRVKFGPVTPGGVHKNVKLSRIITRLDPASDPVTLRVYAANSPDQVVLATTPAWATIVAATTPYSMPRIVGNSLLFELYNDTDSTRWAVEGLSAILDVTGRTRHGRL